jgi:hypothetical protein
LGQPLTPSNSGWTYYALIGVAVIACYAQVARFDMITFDDLSYVRFNPHVNTGLTADNIAWAMTGVHRSNWHPLTWISHMIDVELFGDWAGGHHLHNVLLHMINAWLLMAVLVRLTGDRWRSFVVAALFALHPSHVESVAWIAERKDVLSTCFGFAALWCWVSYVRGRQPRLSYAAMCVLFACSLMSKSMLVTLPCVMLLLDVWPLRRFGLRAVIEKLPLAALSAIACAIILWAQSRGEAVVPLDHLDIEERLVMAIYGYGHYLWMTVWPVDLIVFYRRPDEWPLGQIVVALSVMVALTIAVIKLRRTHPAALIGWLWFLGMLVPVIGLIAVGAQAYADRYTYVPTVGLFIAFAWLVPKPRYVAPPVIVMLAALCFVQVGHWRDTFTLFDHALAVDPQSYRARIILGKAHFTAGDLARSERDFRLAAELQPHHPEPHRLLGDLYRQAGRTDDAITAYEEALKRQRHDPLIRRRLREMRERSLIPPDNPDTLPPP